MKSSEMPSRDCWPYLIRGNGTETGGDVPKETQLVECGDLLEAMWDVLFCAQAPPGWAHGTEKVSFTLLPLRAWGKPSVGAESGLELFRGCLLTGQSLKWGQCLGRTEALRPKKVTPVPLRAQGRDGSDSGSFIPGGCLSHIGS